jgi:hypothetical protein
LCYFLLYGLTDFAIKLLHSVQFSKAGLAITSTVALELTNDDDLGTLLEHNEAN